MRLVHWTVAALLASSVSCNRGAQGSEAGAPASAHTRDARDSTERQTPGVRPGICMIAEPTLIVEVDAASQASTLTASVPQASAAHTES